MQMYCPKCGEENTQDVRYCRKCGAELEAVAALLDGRLVVSEPGKGGGFFTTPSWELAMLALFLGVAILVTAFILGFDYITGFPTPWLAMLIVAFPLIGYGIAQIIKVSTQEKNVVVSSEVSSSRQLPGGGKELPESRTDYVSADEGFEQRTADLVPGSVVEATTRHLEMEESVETNDLSEPKDGQES